MSEDKKKRVSLGPRIEFGRSVDAASLGDMARANPAAFGQRMLDLIDSGKVGWHNVQNLQGLYRYLGPVMIPHQEAVGSTFTMAVSTSAFPLLTGAMTRRMLEDQAAAVENPVDELVTDFNDPKKVTIMTKIRKDDAEEDRTDEGMEFPEVGVTEEYSVIEHHRWGRRLTITQETIDENDVPDIVRRINGLGELYQEHVIGHGLDLIMDYYGSANTPDRPYVYRPNGIGTALYQTSATTLKRLGPSGNRATTNSLVDDTDLDAAMLLLGAVLNERDKPVMHSVTEPLTWFGPKALEPIIFHLTRSEYTPGVVQEVNMYGPRGPRNMKIVCSPWFDLRSATAWYLGYPKAQFRRKTKFAAEYVSLGNTTESYLRSRIAMQMRVACDVTVGADDYIHVVQSLAASTPPNAT